MLLESVTLSFQFFSANIIPKKFWLIFDTKIISFFFCDASSIQKISLLFVLLLFKELCFSKSAFSNRFSIVYIHPPTFRLQFFNLLAEYFLGGFPGLFPKHFICIEIIPRFKLPSCLHPPRHRLLERALNVCVPSIREERSVAVNFWSII